jgi:hypothetical protein
MPVNGSFAPTAAAQSGRWVLTGVLVKADLNAEPANTRKNIEIGAGASGPE